MRPFTISSLSNEWNLPKIVVSHDCAALACSCNCGNTVLCAADVRIAVVGCCDEVSVGCIQAQTIFAFLVKIDFPFGEFFGFVILQGLVFDGSVFCVLYDALNSDFCRAEGGVGLCADCNHSIVGGEELKHKVALVRLFDDIFAVYFAFAFDKNGFLVFLGGF